MDEIIYESAWSDSVSNDPKHRPQLLDRPSTTVRREWCRRPQEAHVADGEKYRRLSVKEIAIIQGFDDGWVDIDGVSEKDRIAALGNAVPPPLSKALASLLKDNIKFENNTLLEICAGIGGLSSGFDYLRPIAKIEMWDVGAKILRTNKPWPSECIIEGMAQNYDYEAVKGLVGLLCGGPPCQPWSQAGHQKGAEDPRDVMGFTPTAIAACEPEVFLFENVPGLFSANEHRAYVKDLLKRMGNPKEGLRYGVATTIVNAADFGVPQVRRRVIILGIKNKSNTYANRILSGLTKYQTHHNPLKPAVGLKPWKTLREAFEGVEVTEPWKKLNLTEESKERLETLNSEMGGSRTQMEREVNLVKSDIQPIKSNKIELVWPGKYDQIRYSNGKWEHCEIGQETRYGAFEFHERLGDDGCNIKGRVILSDYISAIKTLNSYVPSSVQMIYFDAPRIDSLVDEAELGYVESTWLSVIRKVAMESRKVLKDHGFFVLQTDEEMAHYGRQVLEEAFGHFHHVSTFAWQKKYAPQNDKSKKTPTDVFDYITIYSKCDPDALPKVGLLKTPDDLIDDGDWRGVYKAGHKGARSGSEATKFHVCAPPYRWEIIDSKLPKGRHWFDPILGVLWFKEVEETGNFWVKVSVKDKDGNTNEGIYKFSVKEPENYTEQFELPKRVWWLLKDDNDIVDTGDLKVIEEEQPIGIRGSSFSIVLRAVGGKPYTMSSSAPGQNRYWEFSLSTLVDAIVTASASFGKNGKALPSRKTYFDRDNAFTRAAVMNWLPYTEYGKTEDASRHVKALSQAGITGNTLNLTAKPQKMLAHLVNLFAPHENDLVISIGDVNAAMAGVCLKLNRQFIHITGKSSRDMKTWEDTGKNRLLAVMHGQDSGDVEKDDPMPNEYLVEPCTIDVLTEMESTIVQDREIESVYLDIKNDECIDTLYAGVIGAYKTCEDDKEYHRFDGSTVIVLLDETYLDASLVSYYATKYAGKRITIVAERIGDEARDYLPANVTVLHAPYELLNWR